MLLISLLTQVLYWRILLVLDLLQQIHGGSEGVAGREGVEVLWDSLIATLRDSKLLLIAEQIQMALKNSELFFM